MDLLYDIVKTPDVLLVVKNNGSVSEIRSNYQNIRTNEKWITIGNNEDPAHMHINSEIISNVKFVKEEKPEKISFSIRFFDENNERILGAFFTKMYDENKRLKSERVQYFEKLQQKYGSDIKLK